MSDHSYSFFVTAYEQNFPFNRITIMRENVVIAEFDNTMTTNYSFNFRAFGGPIEPIKLTEEQIKDYRDRVATIPYETSELEVTGSTFDVPGYEPLAGVLTEAYDQSARGKGKERHANEKPFTEQPIMRISRGRSSIGGLSYQIQKKADEAIGMVERGNHEAACKELMGAINYAAAMILLIREQHAGVLPVSVDHHPV